MIDAVITLITTTWEIDDVGNQKPVEQEREVFCQVRSVGRAEFYTAAQNDLHPEYVFIISHYKDYNGEKFVKYTDWQDVTHELYVLRTYRDGDSIELTCEERTGRND